MQTRGGTGNLMLTKPASLLALLLVCGVGRAGEPVAVGPPFIAHLPQGTVEVVGVTVDYRPTRESRWWRPDGSVGPIGPFRAVQDYGHRRLWANEKVRTFLVRFEGLPADASKDPVAGFNSSDAPLRPPSRIGTRNWVAGEGTRRRNPAAAYTGAPSWDAGSHLWMATSVYYAEPVAKRYNVRPSPPATASPGDEHQPAPHYYRMFAARVSAYAQTTDLRVGVSMGEWETVMSWKPDSHGISSFTRDGREWRVAFRKARTVRNNTEVILRSPTYTYGQWNKRLVAEDNAGREHTSSIGTTSGGDIGTAVFDNLPVSSIKEFRLQVRPYHAVEFHNISLHPGRRTLLTVVSSDDAGEAKE